MKLRHESCAPKWSPYRRFLVLWTGQLLSGLGSGMTAFALGVYVFRLTGTVTGFAAVVLSLFVPSILLRPVGGILADRVDRRRMIIAGDAGAALGVLYLLVVVAGSRPPLWLLYAGIAVSSACGALQNPAYKALVSDVLMPEQYSRASGLVQLAASAQHLVSPLIAGLLMAVAPIGVVLAIDVGTFAAAIVAVLALGPSTAGMRSPAAGPAPPYRQGRAWRAIAGDQGVRSVVMILAVVTFFVGCLQTLFAPMMLTITDARTLGFVQSVSATGMVASSLILGLITIGERHGAMLTAGLIAAGTSLACLGVLTDVRAIGIAFFLFFAALPLVNISAEVIIRRRVPAHFQGRAWGAIGLLTQLGYVAAYAIAGWLADALFEPMLRADGPLAATVGRFIGVGAGRGMGLMIVTAGAGLLAVGVASLGRLPTVPAERGTAPRTHHVLEVHE